jgi:hypothetical protein
MIKDKDYLVEALGIIDEMSNKFPISFDEDNKYYSILLNVKKYLEDNIISLSDRERLNYEKYILSLNIPNLQSNIDSYFGGDVLDDHYTLKDLSDNQLVDYVVDIFRTISLVQHDNLLLAKYGIVIWNTGFHDLAKCCRGRVIDMNTMNTISHPFDKFFNINETPETDENIVKDYINKAKYIYSTDKKDGSTISVSLYKNKPLITTNGSFDNDQIKWALEIFNNQYPSFLPNLQSGYTYIFEIIHPENKIVVNYGNEKALYLLAIRDLKTKELLPLDTIHQIADKHHIPYPEVYDFTNLDIMIKLAKELKGVNREGWVFRVGTADGEKMFKLKLEEYFAMHKGFGKITPTWVYKNLINGDLDDYIAICNEYQKNNIQQALDEISRTKDNVRKHTTLLANEYLSKYNIPYSDFNKDRNRMIIMVNDILNSDSPFKHYVVQYLKNINKFETQIEQMRCCKFKNFYKMFVKQRENSSLTI